jgi:hypothetical protein
MATNKLSKEQAEKASAALTRLDRVAASIQENHEAWGMSLQAAKSVVNYLDKVADEIEIATFGEESLARRQAHVMAKNAKVIQQDKDESYMATFSNPMEPHQTESDEPYMSAYGDDQSSAVASGKSTSGRPLAPGH